MYRWAAAFAFLVLTTTAQAGDSDLNSLATRLAAIRVSHGMNRVRDAGPELTPVKRELRAWIEKRIAALAGNADPAALAKQLNEKLSAAGLTCGEHLRRSTRCEEKLEGDATQANARGYVGDVEISLRESGRYLVVKTDVGVRCGYDESAYVYEHRGSRWHLLLASEQDRYGEKAYDPQLFLAIDISPLQAAGNGPARPPLILTLGLSPWCQSNWQVIYARLWRASPRNPSPHPLLDTTDTLFLDDDSVTGSRVTDDDVLFEYHGNSIDDTVLVRPHVMHYRVLAGDRLARVAPVALNPNDFVDEWLTRPWPESVQWTDTGASALAGWYRTLHKRSGLTLGEFDGDAARCRRDPTLWQVSLRPADANSDLDPPVRFLVRRTAPYGFTLAGIDRRPYKGCNLAVPKKKDFDTLFP